MAQTNQSRASQEKTFHSQPITNESTASELSTMIDDLLNNLTTKFNNVSAEITAKMDDMSRRLDNLEASILTPSNRGEAEKAN